eukprot:GEMP01062328.1.p1 GENE.GEMP01062328.1~~GEMP01062328.1.p1  ORF type:complete len:121 (+),score=34.32 GEMP01062328.1:62-424(+)
MYGPPDDPFCERPATVVKNILTSNKGWEKLWTNGGELAFCLTREEFHDELSTFIDAEDAAERNLAADEVDMMEAVLGEALLDSKEKFHELREFHSSIRRALRKRSASPSEMSAIKKHLRG